MPKKAIKLQTGKKTYSKCETCGKTKNPEEQCWRGAGAHLEPKHNRPEDSSENNLNSKAQKSQYNSHRPAPSPHHKRRNQKLI